MRVHIKSQFGAEFRRYSIVVGTGLPEPTIEEFISELFDVHKLTKEQKKSVTVSYIDKDGSNLPISNDDNLRKALNDRPNMLRITLQNKGESYEEQFGYGLTQKTINQRIKKNLSISSPQEFRRVSSILDADTLPTELRRVQLCKNYNNKPLGFSIRSMPSFQWTSQGPIMTNGIFIAKLMPKGLAASTNILQENDEILEVNGINIRDKTLDQVTDIMLANAANLILTTRPSIPQPQFHPMYNPFPPPYSNPPPGFYHPMMHPMQFSPVSTLPHPTYPGRHHRASHYIPHVPPHHLYNQENIDEKHRLPSPLEGFSRESTYRLSDKTAQLSLHNIRTPPRRPMSMHPGWMYSNNYYGY